MLLCLTCKLFQTGDSVMNIREQILLNRIESCKVGQTSYELMKKSLKGLER